MAEQPAATPAADSEPHAITASVTATGTTADAIAELAAVEEVTPESLVVEWAAGNLALPTEPIDASGWAVFTGSSDLSDEADDLQGFGERGPMSRVERALRDAPPPRGFLTGGLRAPTASREPNE